MTTRPKIYMSLTKEIHAFDDVKALMDAIRHEKINGTLCIHCDDGRVRDLKASEIVWGDTDENLMVFAEADDTYIKVSANVLTHVENGEIDTTVVFHGCTEEHTSDNCPTRVASV